MWPQLISPFLPVSLSWFQPIAVHSQAISSTTAMKVRKDKKSKLEPGVIASEVGYRCT